MSNTESGVSADEAAWIEQQALSVDLSTVLSCDPSTGRITFARDGHRVTRQVTERYTRVMGYHRPVSNFNKGKQSEFADRKFFVEEEY